jgi:formylglycine-generating enzyme required for sulfatase activity
MQTAIDKIRELRALHDDGLLSPHEFDQRKNAILDAAYAAPVPAPAAARNGTDIGLMAGQEVGPPNRRYRLERLVAHGGMAQVWQATDLATHAELGHSAQVALKILAPELTQNPHYARLLVEEAARARRLAHEHIVRVYDWARDPATASYFVIMEYLEGEDLDHLLARDGPVSLERALALLAPVAQALEYAWDRHRLVHRDIKPGNVFVTKRGDVKLLDFGIAARARAGAGASALVAPASSGTAGYRAPEAATPGRQPERTLDVYAVAVMIWRMVSGVLPLPSGPAPTGVANAGLSERQWQVLQAGFSPEAAARPSSVGDLLAGLREADAAGARDQAAHELEAARRARADEDRRKAQAAAAAAARAVAASQRRERERQERAAAEAARRERKEALRQQLLARRAEEAEKARLEREAAQRQALQAKAAAAYVAEQQRTAAAQAAAVAAEPASTEAGKQAPAQPAATGQGAPAGPAAHADGVLRDQFIDGSGSGPALALIPAGRFQMGSPEHERRIAMAAGAQKNWLARETPQHWVGIERAFALGRHPVSVGEWRAFVRDTGWQGQGEVDWDAPGFAQTDTHPVVGITWHDAQRYVQWLSAHTGQRYRLPSEAEWEYACRAGTRTAFSCGDTIGTDQANYDGNFTYNGGAHGVYRKGTTPAGAFPPNPWGLCDMHGNVWEWVQDVVHENYEGAPADGSAWEEGGDQSRRILRGGSWLYNPRYLRSALRNGFSAVLSNDIVGFRVVRELGG